MSVECEGVTRVCYSNSILMLLIHLTLSLTLSFTLSIQGEREECFPKPSDIVKLTPKGICFPFIPSFFTFTSLTLFFTFFLFGDLLTFAHDCHFN